MPELLAEFDIPLNPWTGQAVNPKNGMPGGIDIDIPFPDAVQIDYVIACPSAPIWSNLVGYVYLTSDNGYYNFSFQGIPHEASKKFIAPPDVDSQTIHGSGCFLTYSIVKPNPPCGVLHIQIYGTNLDLLLGD